MKEYNRIKQALADRHRTGKWLAQELSKDPATVSRWCTNNAQPSIETLDRISLLLNVDIRKLLNKSR